MEGMKYIWMAVDESGSLYAFADEDEANSYARSVKGTTRRWPLYQTAAELHRIRGLGRLTRDQILALGVAGIEEEPQP